MPLCDLLNRRAFKYKFFFTSFFFHFFFFLSRCLCTACCSAPPPVRCVEQNQKKKKNNNWLYLSLSSFPLPSSFSFPPSLSPSSLLSNLLIYPHNKTKFSFFSQLSPHTHTHPKKILFFFSRFFPFSFFSFHFFFFSLPSKQKIIELKI